MKNNTVYMALTVFALAFAMSSPATAITSDDSDNSTTVTVQVSSKIAVDISPSDLEYGTNSQTLEPGSNKTNTSNGPGSGYSAVEIENTGSENITQVWMNTSTPDSNPFGSGLESEYDSGNFVEISPTGEIPGVKSDNYFTYVNRKEFNESNDLSYVFTPQDGFQWNYGRFRVGDQEFFWAVNASSGSCTSGDGDDFRVGNSAHNKTSTGSTNFRSSSEYDPYPLTSVTGSSHGLVTDVTLTPPDTGKTRHYDVLTSCDGGEGYTIRTRYNPTATDASDLTFDGVATQHLINSSKNTEGALQPGEHFQVNTSVRVPNGVVSGSNGISGILRVFVGSQ